MTWRGVSVLCGAMFLASLIPLLIPTLVNPPGGKPQEARLCRANLQTLEGAKTAWAYEFSAFPSNHPDVAAVVGPGRYIAEMPTCPGGGSYTMGRLDEKAQCSIPEHRLRAN